jgi:hypothetical protein
MFKKKKNGHIFTKKIDNMYYLKDFYQNHLGMIIEEN